MIFDKNFKEYTLELGVLSDNENKCVVILKLNTTEFQNLNNPNIDIVSMTNFSADEEWAKSDLKKDLEEFESLGFIESKNKRFDSDLELECENIDLTLLALNLRCGVWVFNKNSKYYEKLKDIYYQILNKFSIDSSCI
jgi:hypothetical protein